MSKAASVFTALGDETRLSIVARLANAGAGLSTATLTASTELTRQAVTKHLDVLADAGLVRSEKAGRERVWELRPEPLAAARATLETFERAWDRRLARLKKIFEDRSE